jgi:hypothetical protein
MADTKQKMMRKLRTYLTAFILFYPAKGLNLKFEEIKELFKICIGRKRLEMIT